MRECRNRLQNCSPARRIQSSWQGLDTMTRRMITAQRHRLSLETIRLHGVVENLSSLNPLDVLKRGYAVVTRSPDNRLITQTEQVEVGDQLTVRVKNGSFPVQVSGQDQERK